jgi:hypothetical protein
MLKTQKTIGTTVHQTNYLLDDVIDSFDIRGLNNGENDSLIKELAIQKMEYGRMCIMVAFRDAKYALSNGLSADDAETIMMKKILNSIEEINKM